VLAAANEREAEFASKYTFPQSLILNLHTAPRINKLRSRARFLAAGAGFGQQHLQVHVLASAPSIIKRQREKPVLRTGYNFDALELSLTHTTQTEENWAVSTVLSDFSNKSS